MTFLKPPPIPGLTWDLLVGRGPGSSPGRGLQFGKGVLPILRYGILRLHPSFAPRWCTLYRPNARLANSASGTPGGPFKIYCQIQHQTVGMVRISRRFPRILAPGTRNQTVAARLEKRNNHKNKSKLARFNITNSVLRRCKVPAQGRDGC